MRRTAIPSDGPSPRSRPTSSAPRPDKLGTTGIRRIRPEACDGALAGASLLPPPAIDSNRDRPPPARRLLWANRPGVRVRRVLGAPQLVTARGRNGPPLAG